MTWQIGFSRRALQFLKHNHLNESFVIDIIKLALQKFAGEDISVSIKRLGGSWEGFYRIRSGKLRTIIEFQFDGHYAYIEAIDWRGNAYK